MQHVFEDNFQGKTIILIAALFISCLIIARAILGCGNHGIKGN